MLPKFSTKQMMQAMQEEGASRQCGNMMNNDQAGLEAACQKCCRSLEGPKKGIEGPSI